MIICPENQSGQTMGRFAAVDDKDYQVPFKFTGKIDKLTISIEPPKLTPADVEKLRSAATSAADAK